MCDTCGCTPPHGNEPTALAGATRTTRKILRDLLSQNDRQAAHNRRHFDRHGILAINLMSSPGAGKTSLLESTIETLGKRLRIAVIEGDLETENDARRIRARGVPAIQITTGGGCHLDAAMVHEAMHQLSLDGIDLCFIENVGNLVCPAGFDLGQHRNVALLSVPEGDDKPAKYPVLFRTADLVLLSKADLLPVLDEFRPMRAEHCLRQLGSNAPVLEASARDGRGLDAWSGWLRKELAARRAARPAAGTRHGRTRDYMYSPG